MLTIIGLGSGLATRFDDGWQFVSLTVLAACAVALFLYWCRNRRAADISGYKIPVAGGIVGFLCLIGVGLVMTRFHFLRDFLLLAVGGGGAVALLLSWSRRREGNSSGSFL